MTASSDALAVEDLKVAFGTAENLVLALKGVSFSQSRGEWLGIIGRSGSGKTVLAKTIAGLLTGSPGVTNGKVLFEGKNLLDGLEEYVSTPALNGSVSVNKRMHKWKKRMRANFELYAKNKFAYVFQNPVEALNPYISVEQHMNEAFAAGGVAKDKIREKGLELLASLRFTSPHNVLRSYPHELSGGMAQRLVVAMALAQGAALIIADECTTSLDLKGTNSAIESLQHARQMGEVSIMFITHDLYLAATCCDRVLIMNQGRLI